MTFKYNCVFVEDAATIAGPYEAKGPLKKYFDQTFDNLYHGEKSWETAEAKILEDSIRALLKKTKKTKEDIDVIISGDLMNISLFLTGTRMPQAVTGKRDRGLICSAKSSRLLDGKRLLQRIWDI